MKQAMPWSVKGVEATARDAAKDAARRAGMTLGEWLNTVIADTSAEREAGAGKDKAPPTTDIEDRLKHLGRSETRAAPNQGANDLVSVLERAIEQSRLQASQVEGRTAGALDAMVRWIERTDTQRRTEMGTIAHAQERTSVALREALSLVTNRLNSIEQSIDTGRERDMAPVRSAVQRLETRIDDLGRREAEGPVPARVAASLRQLEDRLVDIAERLERKGSAHAQAVAPERIERIEATLGALVETLRRPSTDTTEERDDQLLASDEDSAPDGEGLDAALRQIRARQRSLDAPAPARASPPAVLDERALRHLEALRQDMGGLTRRLDELSRSRDDHPLAGELSALSSAVQGLSPRREIEALERGLHDLARVVEQSRTSAPAHPGANVAVDRLSGEIASLVAELAPLKSLGQLRDDVDRLSQKLDRLPDEVSRSAALEDMASEIAQLKASVAGQASAAVAAPSVEKAIAGLAERLDSTLADRVAFDPAALKTVQTSIDEMRWAVGTLTEHASRPDPGLARIEERIQAVAGTMESLAVRGPDPLVADLGTRMARLQETIEARLTAEPDTGQLETLIRSLQSRLDAPAESAPMASSFEALERQLASMSGALERTDDNVSGLRAMESAIGELFERIDDAKRSTIVAAELAAERAAATVVQSVPDQAAAAPLQDARTSQALEAVQDTMERIVERLAMLESDMTSDRIRLMDLAERAAAAREDARPVAAPAASPQNAAEKIAAAAAAAQAARNLDAAMAPRARVAETRPEARAVQSRADAKQPSPAPAFPSSSGAVSPDDARALAAAARASMAPGPLPPLPAAGADEKAAQDGLQNDVHGDVHGSVHDDLHDGMLLEPGTGRPAALDDDADTAPDPAADAGMSSFIASARMAAQNTVTGRKGRKTKADTAATPADTTGTSPAGASPVDQARRYLESRRRPLLLGLAALVVAFGTVQVVRNVAGEGPMQPQDAGQTGVTPPETPRSDGTAAPSPEKRSEAAPADKSSTSLLDPKVEAPSTFAARTPVEPDTVGAIGTAPPAGQPGLSGDNGRGLQLPIGDLPQGALPQALSRAAASGNAAAQFEIASRYFDGRGMQRDPRAAAKWFERAANQGFAPAQYRLGSMYEKGLGVSADLALAKNWYRQAADRGNAKAMHNLGVLIADGAGGKPDYDQAAVWFRRAADLGVRDSQYNLAILTARGLGVTQNLAQSYTWFSLAAAQGDEDAARKRDEVGGRLDAATLASAKAAADSFRSARMDEAANDLGAPAGGWDAEASAIPGKAKSRN